MMSCIMHCASCIMTSWNITSWNMMSWDMTSSNMTVPGRSLNNLSCALDLAKHVHLILLFCFSIMITDCLLWLQGVVLGDLQFLLFSYNSVHADILHLKLVLNRSNETALIVMITHCAVTAILLTRQMVESNGQHQRVTAGSVQEKSESHIATTIQYQQNTCMVSILSCDMVSLLLVTRLSTE